MRKVLICCPTHKGMTGETKESVRRLCALGAEFLSLSEASDIAGGRSWLLSQALVAAEAQGRDVILCVDDDVQFTVAQAEHIVELARHTGPVSALYPTRSMHPPAMRWRPGLWLTGMGFLAVPTERLRTLANKLELRVVEYREGVNVWPFSESRAHPELNMWLSDDYDFCAKLGGVRLVNVNVGHMKLFPLRFSDEDGARLVERQYEEPAEGFLGWKYEEGEQ